MKLFSLLKNLLSIQELRNKITYTLILTGVYVFLSYVIMPGIIIQENVREYQGIAFAPFGLLPYVYSTVLVGFFTQNKRKFRVYSWVVALLYTIFLGSSLFSSFAYFNVLSPGINIYLYLFLSLIGTSICIYIAEKITEKGICDGRDLLMAVSVIIYLPKTIAEQFIERLDKNHLPLFVLDLLLIFLSLGIAIFIHQTLIRIPIKTNIEGDPENTTEANKHILMKLNAVADFPINFSIAIQILALRVVYFYNDTFNDLFYSDMVQSLFLFGVTFLFTFLYTTRYITPETIKREFLALTNSFPN